MNVTIAASLSLRQEHKKALLALLFGICLPLLDTTVVGVAIPRLANRLNASLNALQWASTGYTLAAACAVLLCAWACRRFGARRLWIAGLLIFLLASLACALCQTVFELIGFRIVQGLGTGFLLPVMQSILVGVVGRPLLKKAMAAVAIPAVLAPILGPLAGGFILRIADWPMIFWVNLPIAAIAILLAFLWLPADKGSQGEPFDAVGFFLLAPAFCLFLWGASAIVEKKEAWILIGTFAFSFCLLIASVSWSLFKAKNPLINIRLFGIKSFRSCMILAFLSSLVFYGAIFFLPLFFIHVCELSGFLSALLIAIHGVGALVSRSFLDLACQKLGIGKTALLATLATALGTLALLPAGVQASPLLLSGALLLRGAGVGALTLLSLSHAYQDIERQKVPDASSLSRIVTLLGASIGAVSVALLKALEISFGWQEFSAAIFSFFIIAALCALPSLSFTLSPAPKGKCQSETDNSASAQ